MNSFGADFLLRFRPFQSSFLPFNPPYISNKGFNSDVVPTRWNAGDTERLCVVSWILTQKRIMAKMVGRVM